MHDVRQVLALPSSTLVAAFDGFGLTADGGDTWRRDNDDLYAHYCMAASVGS